MTREAQAAMQGGRRSGSAEDLVSRENSKTVKAIAIAARDENETLKARIDALAGKAAKPAAKKRGSGARA